MLKGHHGRRGRPGPRGRPGIGMKGDKGEQGLPGAPGQVLVDQVETYCYTGYYRAGSLCTSVGRCRVLPCRLRLCPSVTKLAYMVCNSIHRKLKFVDQLPHGTCVGGLMLYRLKK